MVKKVIAGVAVLAVLVSIKPILNWCHQKWLISQKLKAETIAIEIARAILTGDLEKIKSFAPEGEDLTASAEDFDFFNQLQSEENPFNSPSARFELAASNL